MRWLTDKCIEVANRGFLAHWDPLLLEELARGADLGTVVPGRTGPGLRLNDTPVHDADDPLAEARAVLGNGRHGLHVHFGFGLGYFLEVDQPAPGGVTLIYEPNPHFVRLALGRLLLEPLFLRNRVHLCCSFERFRYLFLKHHASYAGNRLFVARPHTRLFPEAFDRFRTLVDSSASAFIVKSTNRLFPRVWQSTLSSLPAHTRLPGWELWRDRLRGKPAVIVGAGPSLDQNLAQLVPHRDKVVLFAVARVAAELEIYGLSPDFLVHVEAQDFKSFIQGRTNLADTTFLLADQTHPDYYDHPHGDTYVFQSRTNPIINSLVTRFPGCRRDIIKTGGSVTTAAFYLAFSAGCDPLILIGQDLALGPASVYAGGGQDRKQGEMRRVVPGYFGGRVETLATYHTNILWYEKALPVMRQYDPTRRFINATEGGARLPGMPVARLTHALHTLPAGPVVVTPPASDGVFQLPPADLQAFLREMAAFLEALRPVRQAFEAEEAHVLACLSRSEETLTVPDPREAVRALAHHLSVNAVCFQAMCKGEAATVALLDKRGRSDRAADPEERLRSWAALAAVHRGLRNLAHPVAAHVHHTGAG